MTKEEIEERLETLRKKYMEKPSFRNVIKRQARALQIALEKMEKKRTRLFE